MTAKTEVSKPGFWARLLGGRRRPYWRTRLSDRYEAPSPVWGFVFSVLDLFIDLVLLVGLVGFVLAALAVVLVGPVFFDSEFFTYGLAAPIGRGLAAVCLETGRCDLRYLLGGLSLAVPVLAFVALVMAAALRSAGRVGEDAEQVTEDEFLQALQLLDDRIVTLRADLVLAGVIPDREGGYSAEPSKDGPE